MEWFRTIPAIVAAAVLLVAGCSDRSDGSDGELDGSRSDVRAETGAADSNVVDADGGNDAASDADVDGPRDADSTDGDGVDPDTASDGTSGGDADGGPECEGDDMCPGNAVCVENECRSYAIVQIRDVTRRYSGSTQEACNDDPSGADLFEIELRDPFGQPLGNARAVAVASGAQTNTDASTVFDGSSNSLDQTPSGFCPSAGFGPASVLSLGCNGSLVTVFTDGAGDVLRLESGQQLVVHEYGNQCCESGCPEEYWEVRVCTAQSPQQFQNASPDSDGIWPTCDTQSLGFDRARGEVTLQLPRP